MFTNTFNTNVKKQLQKRVKFNGYTEKQFKLFSDEQVKQYNNWISRVPFIIAYSNVRFMGDDSYKQYSILGNEIYNEYKKQSKKNDFLSYYQITENFGVSIKPKIKSFEIKGRGTHGTLREADLVIQCYTYQQYFNIKKYFEVPTTSLFIQYGHIINDDSLSKIICPPIMSNISNLNKKDTYLDENFLKEKFKNSVDIQYINAAVYGLTLDQQDNVFTLTIQLMTINTSQITNIIKSKNTFDSADGEQVKKILGSKLMVVDESEFVRSHKYKDNDKQPQYMQIPSEFINEHSNIVKTKTKETKTFITKDKKFALVATKVMTNIRLQSHEVFDIVDNWYVYINIQNNYKGNVSMYLNGVFKNTTRSNEFNNQNNLKFDISKNVCSTYQQNKNFIINSETEINYVTLNWIIGLVIEKLWQSQNENSKPINFIIKPEYGYNANYISNNNNVIILNQQNYYGPVFASDKYKLLKYNYLKTSELYENLLSSYIDWNFESNITKKDYIKLLYPKGNNDNYAWFGNIYIKLDSVIDLLTQNQQITIDGILSGLFNLISSATDGKLNLMYGYNQKREIYQIQQTQLNYINYNKINIFQLKNYGYNSIIKDLTYDLKIPEGYKISMMQLYADVSTSNIFQVMFGKNMKPYDISKKQILTEKTIKENIKQQQQVKTFDTSANIKLCSKRYFNKAILTIPQNYFNQSEKFDIWNKSVFQTQVVKIENNYNNKTLSSIFYMTIQFTLDFIANINWGQVFKLYFNPLGWQCKFYVSDVTQRVDNDYSKTTIKGVMLG